jgi:hypothetical protein
MAGQESLDIVAVDRFASIKPPVLAQRFHPAQVDLADGRSSGAPDQFLNNDSGENTP